MEDIELPYIIVGDTFPIHIYAYEIDCGENKRIHVFGTQLMGTIIDNTTLANFNFNMGFFFRTGIRLIERFPHRETELNKILILFWKKMQLKFEQLQEK